MKPSKLLLSVLIAAYAVLWVGGVISYVFRGTPPSDSRWTAPLFLALAAAVALVLTAPSFRLSLLNVGLIGLAAELAGVRWGYPFGRYTYTGTLSPQIMGVPVVMGCAWLLLFAYVKTMLHLCGMNRSWQPIYGAVWMLALDQLIDPLASGPLGYWIWLDQGWYYGIAPMNFAGWFLVGLVLFVIFRGPWPYRSGIARVGLSIIIFFSLIALARGLYGPLLVGVALCLLHGYLRRRWRSRTSGL
ncbi:carotenoid biosynthesis protein [bacterium]|nr:carotenoid biosynthesis protein [bacterium]